MAAILNFQGVIFFVHAWLVVPQWKYISNVELYHYLIGFCIVYTFCLFMPYFVTILNFEAAILEISELYVYDI